MTKQSPEEGRKEELPIGLHGTKYTRIFPQEGEGGGGEGRGGGGGGRGGGRGQGRVDQETRCDCTLLTN